MTLLACAGKAGYGGAADAEKAIAYLTAKYPMPHPRRVYCCELCTRWHLTTHTNVVAPASLEEIEQRRDRDRTHRRELNRRRAAGFTNAPRVA